TVLPGHVERAGELPPRWQGQARFHGDPAGKMASRIEHYHVPFEIEQIGTDDDPPLRRIGRREELEAGFELLHTGRDLEFEGVHFGRMAAPLDWPAGSLDRQAGKQLDRSDRRMIAG